jgi:hypothetical protein
LTQWREVTTLPSLIAIESSLIEPSLIGPVPPSGSKFTRPHPTIASTMTTTRLTRRTLSRPSKPNETLATMPR